MQLTGLGAREQNVLTQNGARQERPARKRILRATTARQAIGAIYQGRVSASNQPTSYQRSVRNREKGQPYWSAQLDGFQDSVVLAKLESARKQDFARKVSAVRHLLLRFSPESKEAAFLVNSDECVLDALYRVLRTKKKRIIAKFVDYIRESGESLTEIRKAEMVSHLFDIHGEGYDERAAARFLGIDRSGEGRRVYKRVLTVHLFQQSALDLSSLRLERLSPLAQLQSVTKINLADNFITKLPKFPPNLRELDVSQNPLWQIVTPEVQSLEKLNFSKTRVVKVFFINRCCDLTVLMVDTPAAKRLGRVGDFLRRCVRDPKCLFERGFLDRLYQIAGWDSEEEIKSLLGLLLQTHPHRVDDVFRTTVIHLLHFINDFPGNGRLEDIKQKIRESYDSGGRREEAIHRVAICIATGWPDLDLAGLGLTALPPMIPESVKHLNCSSNDLRGLPPLASIEFLEMQNNPNLSELPDEFSNLVRWNMRHTATHKLPLSLPNLKKLDCSYTKIREIKGLCREVRLECIHTPFRIRAIKLLKLVKNWDGKSLYVGREDREKEFILSAALAAGGKRGREAALELVQAISYYKFLSLPEELFEEQRIKLFRLGAMLDRAGGAADFAEIVQKLGLSDWQPEGDSAGAVEELVFCYLARSDHLHLQGLNLSELPGGLASEAFAHVRSIDCSHNRLTYLPQLPPNLEKLVCCYNRISDFEEISLEVDLQARGNREAWHLPFLLSSFSAKQLHLLGFESKENLQRALIEQSASSASSSEGTYFLVRELDEWIYALSEQPQFSGRRAILAKSLLPMIALAAGNRDFLEELESVLQVVSGSCTDHSLTMLNQLNLAFSIRKAGSIGELKQAMYNAYMLEIIQKGAEKITKVWIGQIIALAKGDCIDISGEKRCFFNLLAEQGIKESRQQGKSLEEAVEELLRSEETERKLWLENYFAGEGYVEVVSRSMQFSSMGRVYPDDIAVVARKLNRVGQSEEDFIDFCVSREAWTSYIDQQEEERDLRVELIEPFDGALYYAQFPNEFERESVQKGPRGNRVLALLGGRSREELQRLNAADQLALIETICQKRDRVLKAFYRHVTTKYFNRKDT